MVERKILVHSLYGTLCVAFLWVAATFWYPVHSHVMESSARLYASVGEVKIGSDDAAPFIPTSQQATGKHLVLNLEEAVVALYDGPILEHRFLLRHVPEFALPGMSPSGVYTVDKKGALESSTIAMAGFPFCVRFGDTYMLHGPPTKRHPDDVNEAVAGAHIELEIESAKKVFTFVEVGTPVYVTARTYTMRETTRETPPHAHTALPATSAVAYGVADIETGQLLLSKGADSRYPIASITKLVTAAVASDVVGLKAPVSFASGEIFSVSDLYYPLLLRSDNAVAERIASTAGRNFFMNNMNAYVRALGMRESSFADASGLSPRNLSTVQDLTVFARHLYKEKKFLLDISKSEDITIASERGVVWHMKNQNSFTNDLYFRGGKLGYTDEAGQTSLAIFEVPIDGTVRPVAVVVLRSKDWKQDTRTLLRWLMHEAM